MKKLLVISVTRFRGPIAHGKYRRVVDEMKETAEKRDKEYPYGSISSAYRKK
jgi:hypothetical protein